MRLFEKKNKVTGDTDTSEQTARRIAMDILSRQRKLADYLNKKAGLVSAGRLKVMLLIFCLGFGAYCLYLVYGAIN